MLKALLKKQMMEIFRSYFFNPKTNKARPKSSTVLFIVLYALLMVVVLGGVFGGLSFALCAPLAEVGMGWLYFAILGLLALFMGVFGSVFNTFSGLYQAKDNDLLLSMPIPVRYILVARLLGVYLMGLMFSAVVLLPAIIVYWLAASFSPATVIGGLILLLLVSAATLLLSCLLGYVVAKIHEKLKNKSLITVLASLTFIAVYYIVYFKANDLIGAVVANALLYGEKIQSNAWLLYQFGCVGTGAPLAILLWILIIGTLLGLTLWVLARSFLKLATSTGKIARLKEKKLPLRVESVPAALRRKEFSRFFSSPNYVLNCGLGIILIPTATVVLLVKSQIVRSLLTELLGGGDKAAVLMAVALCLLASMNDMTAPSVSLEGKSLWLLQSLPVDPWQVLKAKLSVQLTLTGLPMLLGIAGIWWVCRPSLPGGILMAVLALLFVYLSAAGGLWMGLKNPNLHWTSEIVPIKQSMSVLVTLLGGWAYTGVLIIGYMLLGDLISPLLYMGLAILLTGGLDFALFRWLKTRGSRLFAQL